MDRIQKFSHFFLYVLKFLLFFLPLFAVLKWTIVDAAFMHTNMLAAIFLGDTYAGEWLVNIPWSPTAKAIGLSAYLIDLLPIWLSLWALIGIFKNYQQGEIFSVANARYYRRIGWMFIFYGLIAITLHDTLMTLATTINNPPGERLLSIGFGSPNIEAIFCGTVVIIVSWVMLEASKLYDDQKLTV